MVKSKNLGLSLNGSSEQDIKMTFLSWRKSINGENYDSNMNIIDRVVGSIQQAVEQLKVHSHAFSEITNKPTEYPPASHDHSYNDLKDKPTIPSVSDWATQKEKPAYSANEIKYGNSNNVESVIDSIITDHSSLGLAVVDGMMCQTYEEV